MVKGSEGSYMIEAPAVDVASDKVINQIKSDDITIPKIAIRKTDRTDVVADTMKQTVDVYKINLRNNHKIKVGAPYIDNKTYANIGH